MRQTKIPPTRALSVLYWLLLVVMALDVGVWVVVLITDSESLSGYDALEAVTLITSELVKFGGVLVLWMLIRDTRRKRPFNPINVSRIRWLAWGIVLSGFLDFWYRLNHGGITFGGKLSFPYVPVPPEFLAALCLFALAEVFRHGLALRQEQDLTV